MRFLSFTLIPIFFPNWPFIFDWNSVIPSDGKCFCNFSVSFGTSFGCFLWTRAKNEDNNVLSVTFFSLSSSSSLLLLLLLFVSSSSGDDDDDSEEEEEDVEEGKLPLVLNLLKLLLLTLLKLLKLLLIIPLLLKKCDATKRRFAERAPDILFILKKENETFLRRKKVSLLYTKSIFTDSFDYELVNLL